MQETKKRWVQSLDRETWQLQPTGSYRVRHDWRDLACTHTRMQDIYTGLPRWCSGKRTHLPTQETQETWVRSLGWEDLLEEEMATSSSSLAWKIPWTGKPGELQSMWSQRAGHNWVTEHSIPPYTEQSCGCREGGEEGWTGSSGLLDADYWV